MNIGTHKANTAWLAELTVELRLRDVSGRDIGDAVASAREFLTDAGVSAEDTFGTPGEYAEALGLTPTPDASAEVRRSVLGGLTGLFGFFAVVFATPSALRGEELVLSVGTLMLTGAALILLLATPAYLKHIVRARLWKIVLVVVVLFAIQTAVFALFGGRAVASIHALPVATLGGALLVGTALWAHVRPVADPITDPLADRKTTSGSRRFLDVFPAWILIVFAVVLVAIDVLLLGGS
jgi:hypothetical protein